MISGFDVNLPLFLVKSGYYHLHRQNIFAHHNTTIRGLENIRTSGGRLLIGTGYVGFLDGYDRTLLNIQGQLVIKGWVRIGKGCRFDIAKTAKCVLDQCFLTGQSTFIIRHGLEIGAGSAISWGCEFLDDDWHAIRYNGKRDEVHRIVIGQHVLIGSHARILKGAYIANNSVVAASAVVTKSFAEENVLLAGNPARIIRTGVQWK